MYVLGPLLFARAKSFYFYFKLCIALMSLFFVLNYLFTSFHSSFVNNYVENVINITIF